MVALRERDIRNAIEDLLKATNEFDDVHCSDPDEDYGVAADATKVAIISPSDTRETSFGDTQIAGAINFVANITITIVGRDPDPKTRDELTERLFNVASDEMNGNDFGLADMMPAMTRFTGWRWLRAVPPERRIRAMFQASYSLDGWDSMDITE